VNEILHNLTVANTGIVVPGVVGRIVIIVAEARP
jgi:hypothetical protein